MAPAYPYSYDDGLVELSLDHDKFTVSLQLLAQEGPIWCAEEGIYIRREDDPETFEDYRRRNAAAATVSQEIARGHEQSLAGAYFGQPRPHAVAYSFGCVHSPQRYWLDPNGDLVLHKTNLMGLDSPGRAVRRFLCRGNARFFFGLERWVATARFTDPAPVPVYNLHFRRGDLELEQQSLCVPLEGSILDGERHYDDVTVALIRFRLRNAGDRPAPATLPITFSDDSQRSQFAHQALPGQDAFRVPESRRVPLRASRGRITSRYGRREVLRCTYETTMRMRAGGDGLALRQVLRPGQSCELLLRVPYVALESPDDLAALGKLAFGRCRREVTRFWRKESRRGAQLRSPIPQLEGIHASHVMHTLTADIGMPDDPDLVNTSVGTSTYRNFSNESCMIVHELDERGLHEEARRRLDLWVKYQGTKAQPGNFTDCGGMFFGAGGFEQGMYNQHHGWVLWCLSEHYLLSSDRDWFSGVADSVVSAADWVFRQRRETMRTLPHSRGWEHGFLPAGSLEDVTEFNYWLSTNALTWRGTDTGARALEVLGHPEARRVRRESNAFRRDLVRGFEAMRMHTPLVRLRDGRWVPHYSSRLYRRGRDQGWIREVLEGAVYLLISGLYSAESRQGSWILDDYQDNLYVKPPFGYAMRDPGSNLFSRGGFSIQPMLLAGLLPHLERDEPEIFLWMFFNAFASVYREEIGGLIEHPMPELGYSNSVTFKTSDEANAVAWLRRMYVYCDRKLLHFGRALPRAWFAEGQAFGVDGVCTHYGKVDVTFTPRLDRRQIVAEVRLRKLRDDPTVLVRFRHPENTEMKSVRVNGKGWEAVDPKVGDVDITGIAGRVEVVVRY